MSCVASLSLPSPPSPLASERARHDRITFVLGMPQLGPFGLSEQWLLKECGDRHWKLIAGAMGLSEPQFTDAEGRPIYAAFCVTSLRLPAAEAPLLGWELTIETALHRVGRGRIGSVHGLLARTRDGKRRALGRLLMISAFVGHGSTDGHENGAPAGNHAIVRREPARGLDLTPAPEPLRDLAEAARASQKELGAAPPGSEAVYTIRPCPALDFNAVGLLYFPTYSAIVERALWAAQDGALPSGRPAGHARRLAYFGNLEPGEHVFVHRRPACPGRLELWADNRRCIAVSAEIDQDRRGDAPPR